MLVAGLALMPAAAGAIITIPTGTPLPPVITVHAPKTKFTGGRWLKLTGRVTNAPAGSVVSLTASPFPYRTPKVLKTRAPAADGTFTFSPYVDRNTRFRVDLTGTGIHASLQIFVIGHLRARVK